MRDIVVGDVTVLIGINLSLAHPHNSKRPHQWFVPFEIDADHTMLCIYGRDRIYDVNSIIRRVQYDRRCVVGRDCGDF